MKILRRLGLEIVYLVVLFLLLDFLPMGFRGVTIALVAVVALTIWFNPGQRLAMALSIGAACIAINFALPSFMDKTYYRPYEKLHKLQMAGFKKYQANQDVDVPKSRGDLFALGFNHPEVQEIVEERPQHFIIDANGYRKGVRESGAFQAIVAGDSFVEGIGVNQDQSLSAQLQQKGIDVYNLGHNGDIAEYFSALKYARANYGISGPVFLFVFEGNDFAGRNYCVNEESAVASIRNSHRALKETHLARFLAALFGRLQSAAAAPQIRVVSAGGAKLGFLEEYITNSSVEAYDSGCLRRLFEKNGAEIAGLFFIPDKSRVYSSLLPGISALRAKSAYAAELAAIAKELKFPFVDLTVPLQDKAQAELGKGKFIYWRDDTHWNPAGIAVAADAVARLLTIGKQ